MSRTARILIVPLVLALAAGAASALEKASDGIYRLDGQRIDDLLRLDSYTDMRVLTIREFPKTLSDAHLAMIRRWVENGGVLWLEGEAVEKPAVQRLAAVKVENYSYRKTTTGKRGGELVVRGVNPQMIIGDHPLTQDVRELYVYPRRRFDGTPRAIPLLKMTDSEGQAGTVIAAVRLGNGYMVLDGTARNERILFGRIKGFDEEHPNALKQGNRWNDYDWDKLLENAKEVAAERLDQG